MDSLLALALLVEAGQDVVAVHGRFLPLGEHGQRVEQGLAEACQNLHVPFHALDLTREFEERVVARFVADYAQGLTPNPCARCNPDMKFGVLFEAARAFGAGALATGHYARRVASAYGSLGLARGVDPSRDQSYFLSLVPAERLALARFPLGETRKAEVPGALAERGLVPPLPTESREICFVPKDDYHAFLLTRPERLPGPGPVVLDKTLGGETLGEHQGLWRHTEGQRRGLGLSHAEPLYVLAKNPAANTLVVGPAACLPVRSCLVGQVNRLVPADQWPDPVLVQTRYRQQARPARVSWEEGGNMRLTFETPAVRPAPGQVAAVYDPSGRVLAGGVILENAGENVGEGGP